MFLIDQLIKDKNVWPLPSNWKNFLGTYSNQYYGSATITGTPINILVSLSTTVCRRWIRFVFSHTRTSSIQIEMDIRYYSISVVSNSRYMRFIIDYLL